MPTVLHLGVVDQPYVGYQGRQPPSVTTGEVAGYLEKKYAVMETFARVKNKDISDALCKSLQGAMQSLLMGQVIDPWGSAMQEIMATFRDFITSKEAEKVGIPGTPTQAALDGVNHRLKHPYASGNPRRPSFRDTGMYVSSFRAWVEQK